jgi:hypothetical protein
MSFLKSNWATIALVGLGVLCKSIWPLALVILGTALINEGGRLLATFLEKDSTMKVELATLKDKVTQIVNKIGTR